MTKISIRVLTFLTAWLGTTGGAIASDTNYAQVGIPRFHFKDGTTHTACKTFAIRWFNERKLLLMPLHLLGPATNYPVFIEPQDVSAKVKSVDVLNLKGKAVIAKAARALLRQGVPVEKSNGDLGGDLMAFELSSGTGLSPIVLSPSLVPVGSKVWLLSKNTPATTINVDRFAGKVERSDLKCLTVKLDAPLTAPSSSGAPIVNEKNELVGMMLGKQDDRRIVMAIPSATIYKRLHAEVGR